MHWSVKLGIAGAVVGSVLIASRAGSADKPVDELAQAALMQQKLEHAQSLLSGLATEDYSRLSTSADKLLEIARLQWRAHETPEYRAQLKDFWTVLEGVKSAADEKNLDAATLAYVQMTITCVKCHKSLRKQLE